MISLPPRPRRPLLEALCEAALGGLCCSLAFPPTAWWITAFLGVGLLVYASESPRRTLAVAAVFGVVFWSTLLGWLTAYLGVLPWMALSLFMTGWTILAATTATWVAARCTGNVARAVLWASVFVMWESASSRIPWGGFSWGRLAVSQAGGPFTGIASWLGIPAVSWLVAFLGALPGYIFQDGSSRIHDFHRSWLPRSREILCWIGAAALAAVPAWGVLVPATGSLRVAGVQGNAQAGLFTESAPGAILGDQLRASRSVEHQRFDVMVWPENAVNLDLSENPAAQRQLRTFVTQMGRPLVFGTLVSDRSGRLYNTILVLTPQQAARNAPLSEWARMDKRHLVPFGEYLPLRTLVRTLTPNLANLLPRDFSPGRGSGVVTTAGVRAGILVCFEVTDDDLASGAVADGAQVLLSPTNNSDFGKTPESAQQLQSARLQAIATGRWAVNVSTVASSGVIAPDGAVSQRLTDFTPGAFVTTVGTQRAQAPSAWLGPVVEGGIVGAGSGILLAELELARRQWVTRRRSERSQPHDGAYRGGNRSVH